MKWVDVKLSFLGIIKVFFGICVLLIEKVETDEIHEFFAPTY